MNGKRWAALGIAAGVFFASMMINTASAFIFTDFSKIFKENLTSNGMVPEEVLEAGNPLKRIAVLEVDGVIQDTGETPSIFSDGYMHQGVYEDTQSSER